MNDNVGETALKSCHSRKSLQHWRHVEATDCELRWKTVSCMTAWVNISKRCWRLTGASSLSNLDGGDNRRETRSVTFLLGRVSLHILTRILGQEFFTSLTAATQSIFQQCVNLFSKVHAIAIDDLPKKESFCPHPPAQFDAHTWDFMQ